MNRSEYLNQLRKYLKKLPKPDYENAMEYFTEYFEEVGEQRAMEELGTPKEAASDILDNLLNQNSKAGSGVEDSENDLVKKRTFLSYLSILLKESGFKGAVGIIFALLLIFLFFLVVTVVGSLGSLFLFWLGGRYFVYGITAVSHSLSGACMIAGMGVFGMGGGFLVFVGVVLLGRWILFQCTQMVQRFIIQGRNKK